MSSIWRTLGIASTRDRTAIRRAYAARLKVVHPEDDAEGFQALRAAYEQALRLAAQAERAPNVVALADWDDEDDDVPAPAVDEAVLAQLIEIAGPPAGQPEPVVSAPPPPSAPHIDRVGREEVQALGATMQALRQAVAADDKDAARALLKTALASPAMDAVSVRAQVEGELGGLILHGGMGAAVLIDPASAEFGWASERVGGNSGVARAVQARRADLSFLVNIRSPQSGHHRAFRALTQPPAANVWRYRLTPGLPKAVRTLLDLIYGQHNSLARELDADAVAWWSAFLSRPQLGPGAFWTTVFLPLLIAAVVSEDWDVLGLKGPAAFGVAYAVALLAVAGGFVGGVLGLGRAQAWWREARGYSAAAWERYGWVGLAGANLAFAALLPAGWAWALIPLPFALATVAWAVITAEPDNTGPIDVIWSLPFSWILPFLRVQTRTPPWVLLGLGLIPLLIVWAAIGLDLQVTAVGRMAGPFYGAAIAFVFGHHSLENAWRYRAPPRVRVGALIAAAVAAAGLPGLVWSAAPSLAYAPLLAGAMAMLVFGERIVTLGWDRRVLRDKLFHWGGVPALFFAVLAEEDARQGGAYLLAGALWLMAGVTAGLVGALRRERELARLAPA